MLKKTVHDKQTILEMSGGKFINKKANSISSCLEWICLEPKFQKAADKF